MAIELPKDAEGREIPLDTKVLYMSDGTPVDVDEFNFSTGYSVPEHKWTVKLMNYAVFFTTRMFLNPPEPPDSWEALEEDLDRCIKESNLCMYYNQNLDCNNCTISGNESRGCTSITLEDIKKRIRKLRGED